MPGLFDPYLSILKDLIFESWGSVRNDSLKNKSKIELKAFLPLMIKVYRNAVKLQLKGIKVANADKVFSVFETHTDILVKGQREVEFGHKVLITRGSSNIILDHKVFEGNPSDKELLLPSIVNIKVNYNRTPQSTSNDGGFCSNANLEGCKKLGLINIVFTKVTKSLQNIVSIPEIEKTLKKWRGTTEAVISNLKRGFGLQRVTWEGFEGFCSKVAWSVLGYNLRVMVNRILL
jgi:IS5 family transposase